MVDFAKMVVGTLERKMGPAAEDFAKDQCEELGIELEDLSEENKEEFADLVEENAAEITSEHDAEFMANVIRKL